MSKIYLDTSILLPILIAEHENHSVCKEILAEGLRTGTVITSATHAYAELYRNLTRGKTPYEVSPELAEIAITEKLAPLMTMIVLDKSDYEAAIARCVALDLSSSIIYDALHVQAAIKAKADVLYTDNLRDFSRLVTEDLGLDLQGVR